MGKGLIDIDGSLKSGSGTIVRYSLALASILKTEIRIRNIRARRRKPGLQPQHLKTVEACCQLTGGSAGNASLKASDVTFKPGNKIRGGSFSWDIGTAGSTTMMSLCLLPVSLFADKESSYTISGGLFQDFAPNAFHMKYVLLNLLRRFSIQADIETIHDKSANQRGAALFIYALTDKGCIIGSDMAGKLGRTSEEIGKCVARGLLEDIDSGATVDRFTADQLLLYTALADGESEYIIPRMSEHIDSNIWLVEKILGAKVSLRNKRLLIRGVGLERL